MSQVTGTILLAICCSVVLGQSSKDDQGPVQAELLAHINVRHLANEATVFARVTLDWNGPDCVLRRGAILQSKVKIAEPRKNRKESRLALSFTSAQCNGADMHPFELVLAAVAEAPTDWRIVPDSQFRMPISFSNPHGSGMLPGLGSASLGDLYNTNLELVGIVHRFPMRKDLPPGAVVDIKGMKLDIGTGPDRSSVLSSKSRDVSLNTYTQFLLVPASVAFRPSATRVALSLRPGGSGSMPPRSPDAAGSLSPDSLETCAPPGCAVDLPVAASELGGATGASIPVRSLGYSPRSKKILDDFEDEESLAWLGPQNLLFAFNPHSLIQRPGTSKNGGTARIIRAVLLDAQDHHVIRAVDWEITDSHRYLWPLAGNRILVHVGNELRVYGAGMEVERRIPLAGPLAFVRIAPNGELMAVATLRELHSRELHTRLREQLGSEPEENVDVAILNKTFTQIASASTTSGLMPPTLLNEGQVKLLAQPHMRYRLAMSTWDNKAITLARFESRCTPELSSIAPDLLFLLTCDVVDGDTQYRVLRADGKQLLRGKSGPREVGQEALGNGVNQRFALKVVHAGRELPSGIDFKGSELESTEVRVYRADDGARLLAVRADAPATSRGSYALSPDGNQVAVLSGTEIKLFTVPAK